MNRKLSRILITIAHHILLMARGPGTPTGLHDSSRAEARTIVSHKMNRRLATIAFDILLIAHGLEDA